MTHVFRNALRFLGPAIAVTLAACAPSPIYKPSTGAVAAVPAQVSTSPDRYAGGSVIWGGRIVQVTNLADHSEVEVLAYPLDGSQRPKTSDTGNGRFIVQMPGFVEPLNFPSGSLITVSGTISGSHAGTVGEANYVFPVVNTNQAHVWTPAEMSAGRSNVSFGLGVGIIR